MATSIERAVPPRAPPHVFRVMALAGAMATSAIAEGFEGPVAFVIVNLLLACAVFTELRQARRLNPAGWLVDPAVAATIGTFFVGFVLSPVIYFDSSSRASLIAFRFLGGDERWTWLSRATAYTLAGFIAFWVGYRSRVGDACALKIRTNPFIDRHLRRTFRIHPTGVMVILGISIAARLAQVSLGIYGYASDIDLLYGYASITQYLGFVGNLGKLALVAFAMTFYSGTRTDSWARNGMIVAFATELIGGLLSGFKGAVILPVVLLGVCAYWCQGRISRSFILLGVVLLAAAYLVIEPFRMIRNVDAEFNGRDITSIAAAVMAGARVANENIQADAPGALSSDIASATIDRSNLIGSTALAINYMDTQPELPEGSPKFLQNVLMSPLLAFVPRLVWPDKPLQNVGAWFGREVLGSTSITHAEAMGPVGYLYFAGGLLAIVGGFLAGGAFVKAVYESFRYRPGGAIVYIGALSNIAVIESAYYTLFAGTLQLLAVLLVAQFFILEK